MAKKKNNTAEISRMEFVELVRDFEMDMMKKFLAEFPKHKHIHPAAFAGIIIAAAADASLNVLFATDRAGNKQVDWDETKQFLNELADSAIEDVVLHAKSDKLHNF